MKTIIIIDDEADARELLRQYISHHEELSLIGEASNGSEAVSLINTLKPTTIFLDIQMPGFNGFEVLTQLEELPEVIFSTAYDQYALKAFEVHAIDYLLKPYGQKRFENALKRILPDQDKVIPLAEELFQKDADFPWKVILHKGTRKLMVDVEDIFYAKAYGDYTKVFTAKEEFISTRGISELKRSLSPQLFFRLHRSHFVNIHTVTELRKIGRYYHVMLTNGIDLRVSDTYLSELKKMLL